MHYYVGIPEQYLEYVVVAVRIFLYAINEYGTFEILKKSVNEMDKSDHGKPEISLILIFRHPRFFM